MPEIIAAGMNTADSTRAMAIRAPPTSSMVAWAASCGFMPCSRWRSTFSTTTMASSTTMPMASTRPNSDRLLSEKPAASITAKVPTSDTGMARIGMIAARQLCRNTITTITTSSRASNRVRCTSAMESLMYWVGL